MSQKLPLCAWCGKTLARRTYRTIQLTAAPGRPMYGWHWGKETPCDEKDEAAVVMDQARETGKSVPIVTEIEMRGPGRVTRRAR